MRFRHALLAALLCAALPALAAEPAAAPLKALPYSPSLDLTSLDRAADPCVDFYQFSCGGWEKNNPIPPDQASWSVYHKLYDDNLRFLWGLLDESAQLGAKGTPVQQKIGSYFAACMDESAIDKAGLAPLKPVLDRIAALKTVQDLAPEIAKLHLDGVDNAMFRFGSDQDFADSTKVIAEVAAGGLGLPDRDYYLGTDERSEQLRQKYLAHVQKTFELAGEAPERAAADARTVLALETELARPALTRVEKRDPHQLYHKMTREQFQALAPAFDWARYFKDAGVAAPASLNVTEPAFFTALGKLLVPARVPEWQTYLRWHALRAASPYLAAPFANAAFEFYGRALRGSERIAPRWKRCVEWVDRDLGEALGQVYVAKTFSPELKQRTLDMTKYIQQAMETEINGLDWMSPATKQRALQKLHTMVDKIGYPDRWRDYSRLNVRRGDFFGNVVRSATFETRRQLDKIGRPLDRGEWGMTPPTVNAYYNPQMNDINFPAGVLQPPLYDPKSDDAPNYGDTGATIGHELTHGFDDEGRQFDAQGNLADWWTAQDAAEFQKRAQCVIDQYAQYTVVDDIKINSRLSAGEDIADLGGTVIAYIAWQNATRAQKLQPIDGFTPDQRFFIGFAQWVCNNERPENLRLRAKTDPHSPGRYRINGVVVNMPEFAKAFSCRAGQPMVGARPCRIW